MTDKRFNVERKKAPSDEEWESLVWPLLREMHGILPNIREVAEVIRMLKKPWFWVIILVLVGVAGSERIIATVEWLRAMGGG